MEKLQKENIPESQNPSDSSSMAGNELTKYDEMITDILKYITSLNTGLLAILAAFNQAILPVFKANSSITTVFVLAFYSSLFSCMFGFIVTVHILRKGKPKKTGGANMVRELAITSAVISYIIALISFLTLFITAIQA